MNDTIQGAHGMISRSDDLNELAAALCKAQAARDFEEEGRLMPILMKHVDRGPRGRGQLLDRFWRSVAFGVSECWYWTGHRDHAGYGRCTPTAYGENRSHRAAWVLFNGPIPDGLKVLHRCDVRNCVNPDHLFLGTQADNVQDMMDKGRHRSPGAPGESNGQARLTRQQVEEIRELVAAGSTQRSMCARFGVSPMTVSRIVRREAWL